MFFESDKSPLSLTPLDCFEENFIELSPVMPICQEPDVLLVLDEISESCLSASLAILILKETLKLLKLSFALSWY